MVSSLVCFTGQGHCFDSVDVFENVGRRLFRYVTVEIHVACDLVRAGQGKQQMAERIGNGREIAALVAMAVLLDG